MIANVLGWAVELDHPRVPQPNMPICTPSVEVTYRTIHPGGFLSLRGP